MRRLIESERHGVARCGGDVDELFVALGAWICELGGGIQRGSDDRDRVME